MGHHRRGVRPRARPCDPDWVRQIRDACAAAGTAFFHKQWGGRTPKSGGRTLDGEQHSAMPPLLARAG
nr:phage Gp37/Gp68 family protein [Cellulomonas iranensis]